VEVQKEKRKKKKKEEGKDRNFLESSKASWLSRSPSFLLFSPADLVPLLLPSSLCF